MREAEGLWGTEPTAPAPEPLPIRRIMETLDRDLERRDEAAGERHLRYWLAEAQANGDRRGELAVRNELVGFYRKTGRREEALTAGEETLALLDALDYEGTVTAGTTLVNCATAFSAFGENTRALALFQRARAAYEAHGETPPELLGGLYNNMGLACTALGRPEEALAHYTRALAQMERVPGGEPERAITCLNMADAVEAQDGPEAGERRIAALVEEAASLLHTPSIPRDGYYAFVCEKCAPSFAYYGYFLEAEQLKAAAEAIHANA